MFLLWAALFILGWLFSGWLASLLFGYIIDEVGSNDEVFVVILLGPVSLTASIGVILYDNFNPVLTLIKKGFVNIFSALLNRIRRLNSKILGKPLD